jgi:uncharacterized tellurite resistance protein B-like protein
MTDKFNDEIEIRLFSTNDQDSLSAINIQLASAILLFEVVKADGRVDRLEMSQLIDILRKKFAIDGNETGRLLEMVSDKGNEGLHLDSFTKKIREHWNRDERLKLLKDFWVIATADKDIDDRETDLIYKIAKLLNLNEEELIAARDHAEKKLETNNT